MDGRIERERTKHAEREGGEDKDVERVEGENERTWREYREEDE